MFSEPPVFDSEQGSARVHVSGSDTFALGHYPDDAIYPGVLSLHCMKTLCDQYFGHLSPVPPKAKSLKRITYTGVVRPGDVAKVLCQLRKKDDNEILLQASIEVNGEIKAKSSFLYNL